MIEKTTKDFHCTKCGARFSTKHVAQAHQDAAGGCRDKTQMESRGFMKRLGVWVSKRC